MAPNPAQLHLQVEENHWKKLVATWVLPIGCVCLAALAVASWMGTLVVKERMTGSGARKIIQASLICELRTDFASWSQGFFFLSALPFTLTSDLQSICRKPRAHFSRNIQNSHTSNLKSSTSSSSNCIFPSRYHYQQDPSDVSTSPGQFWQCKRYLVSKSFIRVIWPRFRSVWSFYFCILSTSCSASPSRSFSTCAFTFLYSPAHHSPRPSDQHSFAFRFDLVRHSSYPYGTLPRYPTALSTSGCAVSRLCPRSAAYGTVVRKDLSPAPHASSCTAPLAAIWSILNSLVLQWQNVL